VKEEDGTIGDLDYLTVRLQHSRDEFPFVVFTHFFFLLNPFSSYYYFFYHVDDDTKIGRDGVSFSCSSTILFFSFFLMRRDDILVLKDIQYRLFRLSWLTFRVPFLVGCV
jgi:hypothetical protein